jgi:hypothetical protein
MWQGNIPSAAKAARKQDVYGAAEAAPFQNYCFSCIGNLAVPGGQGKKG